MRFLSTTIIVGTMAATATVAQEPVASLQDLIGARGTAVDSLARRGYSYHHTSKTDDSSYSYWLEDDSGRCLSARITDGRVASVVYAAGDCIEIEAALEQGFFRTVCGVIRDGETYRYRCQAKETNEDGRRETVLRFPDNEMTFVWLSDSAVTIEREGLVPEAGTFSTSEGETDVFTDEMTYFYISDREMAAMEIRNFRD
ncbi:MAG: hypothetical protein ACWGPN_15870 [Gammaproteobacteria bacterium]